MANEWFKNQIRLLEEEHCSYGYIHQVNVKQNKEGYIIWTVLLTKQGQKDTFSYSSADHSEHKYFDALKGAVTLMKTYENRLT